MADFNCSVFSFRPFVKLIPCATFLPPSLWCTADRSQFPPHRRFQPLFRSVPRKARHRTPLESGRTVIKSVPPYARRDNRAPHAPRNRNPSFRGRIEGVVLDALENAACVLEVYCIIWNPSSLIISLSFSLIQRKYIFQKWYIFVFRIEIDS